MLRKRDSDNKAKMKKAADSKSYVKQSTLKEGDVVLVKLAIRRRKTDPAYGEQPYRVKQIKGSMVTAQRGNHRVTRNSSFSSASTMMSTSMPKTAGATTTTTTLVEIIQSRQVNP